MGEGFCIEGCGSTTLPPCHIFHPFFTLFTLRPAHSLFLVFEFCEHDMGRLVDDLKSPFSLSEVKCLAKQVRGEVVRGRIESCFSRLEVKCLAKQVRGEVVRGRIKSCFSRLEVKCLAQGKREVYWGLTRTHQVPGASSSVSQVKCKGVVRDHYQS